jgi:hypothetical protein
LFADTFYQPLWDYCREFWSLVIGHLSFVICHWSLVNSHLSLVKRFWILDLRFWIDPVHKGTGLGDFRLSILDLFRPNMAGLEPKNNSIFQNPKSQIGTVNSQGSIVIDHYH